MVYIINLFNFASDLVGATAREFALLFSKYGL